MKVRRGTPADTQHAIAIWRVAVDATHQFLTPKDRAEIDAFVVAFLPTAELWMVDDGDRPVGFLIMDGTLIDALFVHPDVHGRGFGSALLAHAVALAPGAIVDASEQASNALPFYEARGFVRTGRSETDPEGRPYPLVHLRYAANDTVQTDARQSRPARISASAQPHTITVRRVMFWACRRRLRAIMRAMRVRVHP